MLLLSHVLFLPRQVKKSCETDLWIVRVLWCYQLWRFMQEAKGHFKYKMNRLLTGWKRKTWRSNHVSQIQNTKTPWVRESFVFVSYIFFSFSMGGGAWQRSLGTMAIVQFNYFFCQTLPSWWTPTFFFPTLIKQAVCFKCVHSKAKIRYPGDVTWEISLYLTMLLQSYKRHYRWNF